MNELDNEKMFQDAIHRLGQRYHSTRILTPGKPDLVSIPAEDVLTILKNTGFYDECPGPNKS